MARAVGSPALLAVLAGAALAKAACQPAPGPAGPAGDALATLLADVGPRVVLPALNDAAVRSEALVAATRAWRDASGDVSTAQAEAQAAWWAAMSAWQVVELLQLGPAGSSLTAVAGEDLRDEAYSWPTVNRCRVDQETVYGEWDADDFFETRLVNVYGLDALEVLLHSPSGENACPSQVDINAEGTWDDLGEAGVQANRAAYAVALAEQFDRVVDALVVAWDPAGGDFSGTLAASGAEGSPYESPEQGLEAVFDALFYLESSTKDRKLGYALGIGACETSSCIEDIESPLAGGSHAWVGVNLSAFRALYRGGEGGGVDDLLRALGHEDLDAAVSTAVDAAEDAVLGLDLPLDAAMAADPAQVQAVYDAVKVVTDLLKGEVATVLTVQIPTEAAGDND